MTDSMHNETMFTIVSSPIRLRVAISSGKRDGSKDIAAFLVWSEGMWAHGYSVLGPSYYFLCASKWFRGWPPIFWKRCVNQQSVEEETILMLRYLANMDGDTEIQKS